MRCDEIRENLVELLYDGAGTSSASTELREHVTGCSECRKELEDLRRTRELLQLWKDESPLRSTEIRGQAALSLHGSNWKYLRYAAAAAMVLMAFLALANTKITLGKDGFTFSTQLWGERKAEEDYYTKTELRSILKRALDESEFRTNETNYLMMQKILDTVEQERWMDLRLIRHETPRARDGN